MTKENNINKALIDAESGGTAEENMNAESECAEAQSFVAQYDVTSNKRYVDSTSNKSDFDRVLDELSTLSKEILEWNVLRWTKNHFNDTAEMQNRKIEAFLGSFILNAAIELANKGLSESAFAKLEQALNVLKAKQKLVAEVESIKSRSEEAFDVSDILGLSFDD